MPNDHEDASLLVELRGLVIQSVRYKELLKCGGLCLQHQVSASLNQSLVQSPRYLLQPGNSTTEYLQFVACEAVGVALSLQLTAQGSDLVLLLSIACVPRTLGSLV